MAIDPIRNRLFVAELGNDSVGIVDLSAGKVIHRIMEQTEPQGVGYEPSTDVLYVANEGKLLAVVPAEDAERLCAVMRNHPLGKNAAIIGEVVDDHEGMVVLRTLVGGERVVTMINGEQLPRIC